MITTGMKKGLEWAPGTDPKCKMIIGRLLSPGQILGLYRAARAALQTGDLVLVVTDEGPIVETRMKCIESMKKALGPRALEFKLVHESAHKVVKLPFEDEAMWVIVDMKDQFVPPTVIWAMPYEIMDQPAN